MGYIDDKAREADNTIKGMGIIIFVIVWIIAAVAGWSDPSVRATVIILGLFIFCVIIGVVISKSMKKENARQQANEKLEAGKKRYYARIQEIGFDKTGKQKIWAKYSNADDFYIDYIWKENDKIWRILAEPDEHTFYSNPDYDNLSNIKMLYMKISEINYIAIEGNYCMLYLNWKPIGFRKDAIEIFRKMVPEKVK